MPNVKLSKFQDLNNKKFLVVDDFPEFRTAIKRMVEAFGGEDVDTASNGEDAVSKIKSKYYDVVMCDYNLGDGKDGQQVLEEAKHAGHITEGQIFILLTAENTAEMVMGALEYEPDGYLVKPFTKEMVHERLMKCVGKKAELADIFKALDGKNPVKAIEMCDHKIAAGGKLVLTCLKIKGRELIKLKRYAEAMDLYDSLLESRELPWCYMGLGQCLYFQGDYDEAITYFEKILEISAQNVEAKDWIAKTYKAQENYIDAQNMYEEAVKMSSKAILRQQALGDLALMNEDIEIAEKAYKQAVVLGKFSCYRRPEDYICYAKILLDKAKDGNNARNSARAANDAVSCLESLQTTYRTDKAVQFKSTTMLIKGMIMTKRPDKAKLMIKKALQILEKEHPNVEGTWLVELGESMIESQDKDFTEKGQQLIDDNQEAS